jgi:hypothetical protein
LTTKDDSRKILQISNILRHLLEPRTNIASGKVVIFVVCFMSFLLRHTFTHSQTHENTCYTISILDLIKHFYIILQEEYAHHFIFAYISSILLGILYIVGQISYFISVVKRKRHGNECGYGYHIYPYATQTAPATPMLNITGATAY